jgi:cytochrome P450
MAWRRQIWQERKAPVSNHSSLKQVNAPASHVKVEEFITMWKEKMRLAQGRPFEALEDLGFLTYDVMCAAGMGSDNDENAVTGMLERLRSGREDLTPPSNKDALFVFPEGDKPALLEAMNAVAQSAGVAGSTPSPRIFHLINNRRASMKKALRDKRSIMLKYVLQASNRLAKEGASFQPRSAVDYIVSREVSMAEKAGRKPVLDSPRMTDGIFTYLIGGQDSTHTTLSNCKTSYSGLFVSG